MISKMWQEAIDIYTEHKSLRKVEEITGIGRETVRAYFKKLGIINKPIEKYTCNEDYFLQDTPEVFYWAGFLAADGCIKYHGGKYKQLSIGLAQKDRKMIELFKHAIQFNGNIYDGEVKNIKSDKKLFKSEICISSDKIFDTLVERWGFTERKSLTYKFPEWLIEHPLVNHFMRGYTDGDGTFNILNKNKNIKQLAYSNLGSKEFLITFNEILVKNCGINSKKPKQPKNNQIFKIEYGGTRQVIKIRDFLYKDTTPNTMLQRKYDIAFGLDFIDLPKHYNNRPVIGSIENKDFYFDAIIDTVKYGFTTANIDACVANKQKTHFGLKWRYATKEEQEKYTNNKFNIEDQDILKMLSKLGKEKYLAKQYKNKL